MSRNIGGSILASSDPLILKSIEGKHGTLQVRAVESLDTHALFLKRDAGESVIAMHPNGYSCHALANRLLAAWEGTGHYNLAMDQFDYILRCGGLGKSIESMLFIAEGFPE